MNEDDIKGLRKQIDKVDADILSALQQRADLAQQIGHVKNESPDCAGEVYSPEREAVHLQELIDANQSNSNISSTAVVNIFREIMSACRALERETSVAYLGPQGTYTMEAAYKQFGHSITAHSLPSIHEVFATVEQGTAHYGVVPVENSCAGSVADTLDCLANSSLYIIGELMLPISHCLMSHGTQYSDITTVYAHDQALAQCRKWLDSHLSHCQRLSLASNATAVQKLAAEKSAAAIASAALATTEDIPILASNIEDDPNNTTRFAVIGKRIPLASGEDKTSIIVSTENKPGSLVKLLEVLADCGISMSHIESRPAPSSNWEYLFFLDIKGHRDDPAINEGLSRLEAQSSFYKYLGSYPAALQV